MFKNLMAPYSPQKDPFYPMIYEIINSYFV